MAKQIINIGATANDKSGDPLRSAFIKVNDNFTELYNALGIDGTIFDPLHVDSHLIPSADSTYDLGSPTKQWRSMYVSTNTIYINNVPLSLDENGNILVDGNIYAAGGGASVTVDTVPPTSPTEGNLWWSAEDGKTYIYYNGAWVDTSTAPSGSTTGNIGFTSDTMYDINGLTINNSDLTHGATASIVLPANGDGDIQLQSLYGGVSIGTGPNNAVTNTWTFRDDGILQIPGANFISWIYQSETGLGLQVDGYPFDFGRDGTVNLPGNNGIAIIQSTSDVELKAGTHTLKLGTDGSLLLDGSAISVIGLEPSFSYQNQTFTAVAGKRYAVDNQGAQIGAILPESPTLGDAIYFVDAKGTFSGSAYLIISGNGNNIMGASTQNIITANESIGVFWNGTEWRYYG